MVKMTNIDLLLGDIPAAPPPPGVTPNFIDPPSIAPLARITMCVTMAFMLVFLALRIYSRTRVAHAFGMDDCKITPAWDISKEYAINVMTARVLRNFGCQNSVNCK